MANERKSIIDKALLESEQIEKAFEANAKEILNRTMSSEIEALVRESLEDSSLDLSEDDDEENDVDLDLDLDDEDESDIDINAGDAGEDLDLGDMDDMDYEDEDSDDMDDMDTDVVDLTDADDEEVVRVFKLMGPDDEIEVVQDGGNINIKDTSTGAEYRIQLGGEEGELDDMEMEDDMEDLDMGNLDDMGMGDNEEDDMEFDMEDEDEDDLEEGVIYEIEIDDEEEGDEDEIEESMSHMKVNLRRNNLKPSNLKRESVSPRDTQVINENRVLKNTINKVKSENEQLKEDYNKMVDALKQFRNKLNEVAIFNSNLTYSVRLFTENTTTKEEKMEIIKRFDDVKSLKESKATYKQLVNEISKSAPIKESIENKLNQTKTSGSSTLINESKVYVNPELAKMKKLWDYDYKK